MSRWIREGVVRCTFHDMHELLSVMGVVDFRYLDQGGKVLSSDIEIFIYMIGSLDSLTAS